MARFNFEESKNYQQSGGNTSFFKLASDGQSAVCRFMFNTLDDLEGYALHEIQLDGKRRLINCIRSYNEPVDNCPFCKANMSVVAKLFIPIYNVDTKEVQIWERGSAFFKKFIEPCQHNNPLVSGVFKVTRHGAAGDKKTDYDLYPIDKDNTTLEDLPPIPNLLGGLILDKNFDEMENFLATGSFGSGNSDSSAEPKRGGRRF